MKRTATSIVLALLSLVVQTRAQQRRHDENVKMGLRRRLVSRPFSVDSSKIERKEGLGDFLFAELGDEDVKLWTGLIMKNPFSMSMQTSPDK